MQEKLREIFGNTADFEERTVSVGAFSLTVFFIDGLCAGGDVADFVLRPLKNLSAVKEEELYLRAKCGGIVCASLTEADSVGQVTELLLNGFCAVLFPHIRKALCFEAKSGEKRTPGSPQSENTVKGAKDAFTETVRTNTGLVRRHLRSEKLVFEEIFVGNTAKCNVTLCYLRGITPRETVEKMRKRLDAIELESLLSPAALEETVTGSRKTAFPLLQFTERTDKFCQGLLSGQVGLLCDGLPEGFLAPVSISRLMCSPEDRAVDYISASFVRVLRYLALFISLLLPAIYTAMAMHHQQMLPTELLKSIIESKQNVPFSTIFEVLSLLAAFEILQEAGLHLPQAIGTTVSIIGGLVVGTAAVDAKLVSPAALIVVAAAGICGFALPDRDLSDAIRIWRLGLTAAAGIAGLFGVSIGGILMLVHLASLQSLGRAYLEPFSEVRTDGAFYRRQYETGGRE